MNLQFSKDDILIALLELAQDSSSRGYVVKALIDTKLHRLNSDINFLNKKIENSFGSIQSIKENFNSFSTKDRKKLDGYIKRMNTLLNQNKKLKEYRIDLSKTSFSNESLEKLESNINKVFKWEKPLFYDDVYIIHKD